MNSFQINLNLANKTLKNIRGIFEKNDIKGKLASIEDEISKENFWKDQKKVKIILKEKKIL